MQYASGVFIALLALNMCCVMRPYLHTSIPSVARDGVTAGFRSGHPDGSVAAMLLR
jgi:hypothetical protein